MPACDAGIPDVIRIQDISEEGVQIFLSLSLCPVLYDQIAVVPACAGATCLRSQD